MSHKKDTRNVLWRTFEKEIQLRAKKKDRAFAVSGPWKTFVRRQSGYKIFRVDNAWVHNNLCVYFGHGGHGLVHEFIPMGEVWISSHHPVGMTPAMHCDCVLKKRGQPASKNYFESTTLHEIAECEQMKKGKTYWNAHQYALEVEKKAGLLSDPYRDD